MNITLLNSSDNLIKVSVLGSYIVEYYSDPEKKSKLNICVYDPDNNTLDEVAPDINKLDLIETINCIWGSSDLYFAGCTITEDKKLQIIIYQYEPASGRLRKHCWVKKKLDVLTSGHKIKIFILSDSVLLIQTEISHRAVTEKMIGNIEFELSLLRLEDRAPIVITDANFVNNGINVIKAVSENRIMIKTGYSWLEDKRMDNSEKSGAFIEAVYITTTSKFIADMALGGDIMDMPLIESAYRDTHIVKPNVTGSYTHYILASPGSYESKCVFYDNETGERIEYNPGQLNLNDMDIAFVINNQPYIKNTSKHEINFLNLKKAEMDISFYDQSLTGQTGNIFILQEKGKRNKLNVYVYPGLRRIISEEREYFTSCQVGDDYYIYC